jgi:ATP-dependent Clp protease protease subunit
MNMPLPSPRPDEDKDDFIDRCMGDDVMTEEYPDESQRRAVCEKQWESDDKEDMDMAGLKMVKNAKEKSADIWIYQDIGEGWFEGFSAKYFADEVKKLGAVDILNVYINSAGGDVFDGVAIYNILKRHKAKVIVEIDALAASIASVIAMAGNEIRMAENAIMMVHNPWGFVMGDAADMRKAAEDMDKIRDSSIVPAYVKQSGMEEEKVIELMDAETWMSAEDAKGYGFIDEITAEKKMAARINPEKYKNVFKTIPEKVTAKPKDKTERENHPKVDDKIKQLKRDGILR